MQPNQQINNKQRFFCRATNQQRILAGVVFLLIAGAFGLFVLVANNKIDLSWWLRPCGFKQRFGLPCPTCGMTTSMIAFCQSKIIEAFYIQPAMGLFCCVLVIIAVLSLFTGVFGVYFEFIKRVFAEVKIIYVILALLLVVICGWAVTLARALTAGG